MLKALAFKPAKKLKAKIHGIYGISEIPSSVINTYGFTVCKQVELKEQSFQYALLTRSFLKLMHKNYILLL